MRPFAKLLFPGGTLSPLHFPCLGTEPQHPEGSLSKVSHKWVEEKRMNTRKVLKSSSESGCDGFVPLSLSVAETPRPSPICSLFSARSLGQVRSKAQTQRVDWWPREARAIWCLHMGACVDPSWKEHSDWVCQAHAHGESSCLWPCGSPHTAESKLSSCYPTADAAISWRWARLVSFPTHVQNKWANKHNSSKIEKRRMTLFQGRRMVRIAIPWVFHSQILQDCLKASSLPLQDPYIQREGPLISKDRLEGHLFVLTHKNTWQPDLTGKFQEPTNLIFYMPTLTLGKKNPEKSVLENLLRKRTWYA